MLSVKATTQKSVPCQWTRTEVEDLVLNSQLPDHWAGDSLITYKLIVWCIASIRQHKKVMKYRLPEVCQLLQASRCKDQSSKVIMKSPLTPKQVCSFVVKVESKAQPVIWDAVVEFPKSASKDTGESEDGKVIEGQSQATQQVVKDLKLSDKVKADIEAVVDESHANLVELHCLIKKLENAEKKHRWGDIDDESYKTAVMEFKSAHQKNAVDGRRFEGKLDIIGVCCPFEDKNNSELEDLVKEKHKTLVMAYYHEVLYAKIILCDGLDLQKEEDVRDREKKALKLVNDVLGIDYHGEADPVDYAQSVKSILKYVLSVVPTHLGNEPSEDEEALSTSSRQKQRRRNLTESPEWESSWEKHFGDAAEEKQRLDELAEVKMRLKAAKKKLRESEKKLHALQKEQEEDLKLLQALNEEAASNANLEENPRKRQHGRGSSKRSQKKKK